MHHSLITFSKAGISALVASAVDFLISAVLAHGMGMYYLHATWIGAVSGGILNCIVNYRWVFRAGGCNKLHVAFKYILVWIGSILLNTGGTFLLTEYVIADIFLLNKIIASLLVAVFWNYPLQRDFVYRKQK